LSTLLIAAVVAGVYAFISTRSTLWDRDEPRFARAAVEMVDSGNYLYPTFNGRLRPDKPILIYWLMSIPVRLFGQSELACRFFSIVGTAVTCLLIFCIARSLFGTQAGLWAMVILSTSLMVFFIGTAATADGVLLMCMTAVMAIFVYTRDRAIRVWHVLLMGLGLAAAMLTKGPVGMLPVLVIIVTLWLARKEHPAGKKYLWPITTATVLGILCFIAWAVPANRATHGQFLRAGIGFHVISRMFKPMESHGGNFLLFLPYYIPVVISGFFPWTLHLPGALSALFGKRIGSSFSRKLLVSWIAAVFLLMTLVATKLPHYILFIWPALAMLVAAALALNGTDRLTKRDKLWMRRGAWFFVPVAAIICLALSACGFLLSVTRLKWSGPVAAAVLVIVTVLAVRKQNKDQYLPSAKILLTGMLIFLVPCLFGVLPGLEKIKISPAIARCVNSRTDSTLPVAAYKFAEPTLNFYLDRPMNHLQRKEDVVSWAQRSGSAVLIIPRKELESLRKQYGGFQLSLLGSVNGFNYSKGKSLEVLALMRGSGESR